MPTLTRTPRAIHVALGLAAVIAVTAVLVIALGGGGPPAAGAPATPPATFYSLPPRPAPAPPGTLVRALRLASRGPYRLWGV